MLTLFMREINTIILSNASTEILKANLLWASRERKNILILFKGLYLKGTVSKSIFKFKMLDSPPISVGDNN